jgi:hypothetical protein
VNPEIVHTDGVPEVTVIVIPDVLLTYDSMLNGELSKVLVGSPLKSKVIVCVVLVLAEIVVGVDDPFPSAVPELEAITTTS